MNMLKSALFASAFLTVAVLPVTAHAAQTVITFDGLEDAYSGKPVTAYSEGGYAIAAATGSLTAQIFVGANPSGIPSVNFLRNGSFNVTSSTGGTVTFDGFDGAFFTSSADPSLFRPVSITGFLAGVQTFSTTLGYVTPTPSGSFAFFDPGSGRSVFDRIQFTTDNTLTAVVLDNLRVTAAIVPPVVVVPSVPAVSAVPEPTSWAMMIGGFGLIGATMRYRKPRMKARFA